MGLYDGSPFPRLVALRAFIWLQAAHRVFQSLGGALTSEK